MQKIIIYLSLIAIIFSNVHYVQGVEEDKKVVEATFAYPEVPEIDGEAAVLIDVDTGAILYSKNPHQKMYPASITKIMTALLAVENLAMEDTFTFTQDILNVLPWDAAKYGYVAGEEVNIRDLIYVLLLRSANEVAIGLGIKIAGTEEQFANVMTNKAKEIGAVNTNFENATGLHDDNHYTTAYDMALIAMEAMENATLAEVWGNPSYIVNPTNVEPDVVRIWNRHNMLVSTQPAYYSYAKGGKTGYTDEAGRTLVTYASRDGRNLMCVVMKSGTETVYDDTRRLFEFGFAEFANVKVKGNETRFGQSEDSFFVSRENMFGSTNSLMELTDGYVTVPNGASLDDLGYELVYLENDKNGYMANIQYKIGDIYLGSAYLKLNVDKGKDENSPYKDEETAPIEKQEELPINIYVVIGVAIAIVVLIIIVRIFISTKGKRMAKRARKKLFKNNKLH